MAKKAQATSSSNALAVIGGGKPPSLAGWEREMAEKAKRAVAAIATGGSFLSIKGKKFRFEGTDLGDYVDAIIVDYAPVNAYYNNAKFDPENPAMPTCFAIAKVDANGDIDHESKNLAPGEVPDVQSDACDGCPQNDFGSGEGRGKACKNMIRVALLMVGSDSGGDVTEADKAIFVVLNLPPTSIKSFAKYIRFIDEHSTPDTPVAYFSVVTRLTFNDTVDFSMVQYQPVSYVPEFLKQRVFNTFKTAVGELTTSSWPASKGEERKPAREQKKSATPDKEVKNPSRGLFAGTGNGNATKGNGGRPAPKF